jgi:tagatose 6-phosphate kinase
VGVILTVTLNTALDVADSHQRPGGRGVNVARVLHRLREPVIATGLVGGGTGASIRSLLGDLRHSFVDIDEPSGSPWERFVTHYGALLRVSRVAVLSGSLPPGLPVDAYARLVEVARSAGVPVVLDASGEPLAAGIAAGPDIVKPNAHELAMASGMPVGVFEPGAAQLTEAEALAAADAVRTSTIATSAVATSAVRAGAAGTGTGTAVVASLGPYGMVASTDAGRWSARPTGAPLAGNPTGAGDAVVAALARGLAYRLPWPRRLADAVGLSGAAVLAPTADAVSLTDYQRLRRAADVREA